MPGTSLSNALKRRLGLLLWQRLPWLLALLVFLSQRPAWTADPALTWHTLRTPHFNIHYHDPAYSLALQVAQVAESAMERVTTTMRHEPSGKIEMVINDDVDMANGSAQIIPYNIVNVYASAPDDLSVLNDYDDYLQLLLRHELTHIVHMDTVSGVPALINWIFGRNTFPNGAQPPWFIEGFAVRNESALSSAGRIRSSLFQMYLRTAALAGVFPDLDQVTGSMRQWPQGTGSYLYGGFFMDYLAQQFGEKALVDLSHEMGGMLVPWTINILARRILGTDYPTLWRNWKALVIADSRALLTRLEQEGLSVYRQLTKRGQNQLAPRCSPGGGQILYYSAPRDQWPTLRLVGKRGESDRVLAEVNSEGGAVFSPDGSRIYFSQLEVFDEFYAFFDLFALDLQDGKIRQLTHGLRAQTPDVSPDGRTLVYIHNRLGKTSLALLPVEGGTPTTLELSGTLGEQAQIYTPRFSPDSRQIAFSASVPSGGRNIYLLDLASKKVSRLTSGVFMDLDPVFFPDGRRILFTSDRNGIYNLHALSLEDDRLVRLTNLVTGAFSPDICSDGSGVAFVNYSQDGYDIAWLDLPLLDRPLIEDRQKRPPPPYQTKDVAYLPESYLPWASLLPRSWFPLFGADPWGNTYGILIGGRDALGETSYQGSLSYGPGNNQLYFNLGVSAHLWYPSFSIYGARRIYQDGGDAYINGRPFPVNKQEYILSLDLNFPFSSVRNYHSLFINYDIHFYKRLTELSFGPMDLTPSLPDDSRLAWISIGWFASNVRRYLDSISAEEGVAAAVSLRYSHPAIGSGREVAEVHFAFRGYLPALRTWHHVLAFGLQGGVAIGDPRHRSVFGIGGLPVRDPIADSYYGYRYSDVYLRGYPPYAFAGWTFWLSSLEYRLPLFNIERGLLTLPFYLSRLHMSIFTDVGAVGLGLSDLTQKIKIGVGAELRLDMLLAYYLPASLRLGYGRGLTSDGINNFYFTLGSGF